MKRLEMKQYWWRRRESKPSTPRSEPSRDVANRRESDEAAATDGDEPRRAIAKPRRPREAFIASLAERLKVLALASDIDAARVASDAIARLLGSGGTGADVVDLEVARRRRED